MASLRLSSRVRPFHAAIGDAVVFALFPLLGSANHDTSLSADTFLRTALPFAVAWAIVGFTAGAYATRTLRSPGQTLARVPGAWLLAGIAAAYVRVVAFDRPFSLSFAIVAIALTGAMLVGWRLLLAFVTRR